MIRMPRFLHFTSHSHQATHGQPAMHIYSLTVPSNAKVIAASGVDPLRDRRASNDI